MDEIREFKNKLIELFRDELGASDENCKKIDECKNISDIVSFFEDSDDLRDLLNLEEIGDLKREIEDNKEQVKDLEEEINSLVRENRDLEYAFKNKGFNPNTFWEEEKYALFIKYQDRFTPTEFEKMLTKK